ncbi:MAG: hypothetical protein PWR24_844 [Desulfonauticus sp.]|jgi:AcrR family transcriptional regulator|nr:MAG: Transcriptional regulator, TetR/AcrR family [Desulfonauticus sp. 38_4375]MDK2921287.1 hypothetical protein [Desulfonauticus sp.]
MRLTGRERRQKILQAAKKLFASKGFKGTTTQKLAQEAGLSEAGLYKYFKNKQEIYEEILNQKIQDIDFYFPSGQQPKNNLKIELRECAIRFLQRNIQDTTFLKIILYSALEENDFLFSFLKEVRKKFFTPIKKSIKKGIENKKIKNFDEDILAKLFFSMIYYTLLLKTLFKDESFDAYKIEEIVDLIIEIFFKGVESE